MKTIITALFVLCLINSAFSYSAVKHTSHYISIVQTYGPLGNNSCDPNTIQIQMKDDETHWYYISGTDPAGKNILSALLTAYNSGLPIDLYYFTDSGLQCNGYFRICAVNNITQ